MNLPLKLKLSAALAASALLASGCGGEAGGVTMTSAATTTPRYSQTMTINVSGIGLDGNVEVRVDGPCTNLTRLATSTASTLVYTCVVNGVGRITPMLVDSKDGFVYGSVKVDAPLPQVALQVTDGTRTGTMVLELDPAAAPRSVEQFMAYVNLGFHTDTVFHRVRPDTGILGGGFTSPSDGVVSGKATSRPDLALEQPALKNLRGTVAMYRPGGRDSANSMFLINTVDNPRFDAGSSETPDGYAVFGRLVEGLNVLDEVAKVPVRPDLSLGVNDVPVTAVRIRAALQTR